MSDDEEDEKEEKKDDEDDNDDKPKVEEIGMLCVVTTLHCKL